MESAKHMEGGISTCSRPPYGGRNIWRAQNIWRAASPHVRALHMEGETYGERKTYGGRHLHMFAPSIWRTKHMESAKHMEGGISICSRPPYGGRNIWRAQNIWRAASPHVCALHIGSGERRRASQSHRSTRESTAGIRTSLIKWNKRTNALRWKRMIWKPCWRTSTTDSSGKRTRAVSQSTNTSNRRATQVTP